MLGDGEAGGRRAPGLRPPRGFASLTIILLVIRRLASGLYPVKRDLVEGIKIGGCCEFEQVGELDLSVGVVGRSEVKMFVGSVVVV